MTELLTYVVSGAVAGGLYAMLAAGLVLTFQTSGIFNFAHGAVAFVTAYLFLQLDGYLGWPAWLAGVVAILVFAPLLGLGLDRVLFRRLHDSPVVVKLVVPIASWWCCRRRACSWSTGSTSGSAPPTSGPTRSSP